MWGPHWAANVPRNDRPLHVHSCIDNTSAVTWQNKLSSRNPRAQVIIRLLSWWETSFQLRFSASDIAGVDNTRAGADSRIAANSSFATQFASLTRDWLQVSPTVDIQGLNQIWQRIRAHSVADSTYDQYSRALRKWITWTSRRGIPAWLTGIPLAAQVQYTSGFVLYGFQFRFGSGGPIRSDSILALLHGIRHFFAASGYDFLIAHPYIRMLLKGISRLDTPRRRKAPVSLGLLELCFHTMTLADPSEQALWGGIVHGVFLPPATLGNRGNQQRRQFQVVRHEGPGYRCPGHDGSSYSFSSESPISRVRLTGSKTNQGGTPTTRMLSRSGHPFLCPVFGALILLQSRKNLPADIPAAVYMSQCRRLSSISPTYVSEVIKRAAAKTGKNLAHTHFELVEQHICIERAQIRLRSNFTVARCLMLSSRTLDSAKCQSLHCMRTWWVGRGEFDIALVRLIA